MIGFVDEHGKYVKGKKNTLQNDVSSQYKDWNHDNQRKRLNADIVQPYTNTGQPSREFIEVYRGDVANNYFSQEQIDKADRNLS